MDIAQISRDIYEETISEIVLSEFAAWLAEKPDRFETAKRHVRELSLDQGYQVNRIENECLRALLKSTHSLRPRAPGFSMSPHQRGAIVPRSVSSPGASFASSFRPLHRTASREAVSQQPQLPIWHGFASLQDIPPNTPDRPAPLNIRSCQSSGVLGTPSPRTATFRSISSPFGSSPLAIISNERDHMRNVPSVIFETTSSLASMVLALEQNSKTQFENEGEGDWETVTDQSVAYSLDQDLRFPQPDQTVLPQGSIYRFADEVADAYATDNSHRGRKSQDSNISSHKHGYKYDSTCEKEFDDASVAGSNHSTTDSSFGRTRAMSNPFLSAVGDQRSSRGSSIRDTAAITPAVETAIRPTHHGHHDPAISTQSSQHFASPLSLAEGEQRHFGRARDASRHVALNASSTQGVNRPLPLRQYESTSSQRPGYSGKISRPNAFADEIGNGTLAGHRGMIQNLYTSTTSLNTQDRQRAVNIEIAAETEPVPCVSYEQSLPVPRREMIEVQYATPTKLSPAQLPADHDTLTNAFITALQTVTRERASELPPVFRNAVSVEDEVWRNENGQLVLTIQARADIVVGDGEVEQFDRAEGQTGARDRSANGH